MIKVHILPCGSTSVDEALPFSNRSRNPLAYTGLFRGKKHRIMVPVTAYLIEHPKGLVLVDTGWDTAIRENARQYEGFANYFASPGFLPEGQAVSEHLTRLGYSPRDLAAVVLSHMDIDHAGGLPLIRDARRILVSESEWKSARKLNPRYLQKLWKGLTIETFPDEGQDLFGDGTIKMFPLHGHSAGMTGIRIGTDSSYLILAGDAGYGRESLEHLALPGVIWNRKEALLSLKKLCEINQDPACIAVLMTHDPEIKPTTIEIKENQS